MYWSDDGIDNNASIRFRQRESHSLRIVNEGEAIDAGVFFVVVVVIQWKWSEISKMKMLQNNLNRNKIYNP